MIMPDPIHAVIELGCGQTLASVMHSLKSFTAKKINVLLGETGVVWQAEYYDRGVRGEESLNEIIRYCYENPVRKGLAKRARDYPYWWCKFKIGVESNWRGNLATHYDTTSCRWGILPRGD